MISGDLSATLEPQVVVQVGAARHGALPLCRPDKAEGVAAVVPAEEPGVVERWRRRCVGGGWWRGGGGGVWAEGGRGHDNRLAVGELADHLGGGGQVVHDHVHAVVLPDPRVQQRRLCRLESPLAEHAELDLAHRYVVRRVLDDGAVEHLAQVLHLVDHLGRAAEGQRVVVVRQLRLCRREFVDLAHEGGVCAGSAARRAATGGAGGALPAQPASRGWVAGAGAACAYGCGNGREAAVRCGGGGGGAAAVERRRCAP